MHLIYQVAIFILAMKDLLIESIIPLFHGKYSPAGVLYKMNGGHKTKLAPLNRASK